MNKKQMLLYLLVLVWAAGVYAQSPGKMKLSIRFAAIRTDAAMQQLKEACPVNIVYDAHSLGLQQWGIQARSFNQAPLTEILDFLLQRTSVGYKEAGGAIVLYQKKQEYESSITGRITDEQHNEPIIGATVRIDNLGVTAGIDGAFTLKVPAGKYTVEISSVGYDRKRITDFNVKGHVELNTTLKRAKGQLQVVTVTAAANKEGVAALYARQKNSAALTDGISAAQIARTPDKNIGEVLKRVSGVAMVDNKNVVVRGLSERYNGSMLNGQLMPSTELNRKQFAFDIIPSNLVDNIVVYKTITPDMSAEFGGGLVTVNTAAIPSENFLSVSAGGSFNDKTTGRDFKGLLIGNKQYAGGIPDDRKLMGRTNWKSRSDIEAAFRPVSFSNNWALYNYRPNPSQNYQVAGARVIPFKNGQKLGLMASLSYRNTWQTQDVRMSRGGYEGKDSTSGEWAAFRGQRYGFTTNLGALGGIGYSTARHKISWQTLFLRTLDQQLIFGTGRNEPVGDAVGYFDLFTQTSLWQQQLKGEHLLTKNGITLRWNGSFTTLDKQRPDNHVMNASYLNRGKDSPFELVDFSIKDAQGAEGDGALRTWSRAFEKNYNWNIDLAVPFRFNIKALNFQNSLKVGYAGWSKDRLFWVLNTGSGYNTGEYQPLTEYFEPTLHPDGKHISYDEFGDDLHKTATLHAGYAMMDNKIGNRLRLVWGVRAEYYNLNGVNQVLDSLFASINKGRGGNNKFDYSELKNREPNLNFFPSANLTYSLTSNMNLRLAYSKSIIRPDLREMSFFREYDFELGGTYLSVTPVRSTLLHHYDFRYEWYPGPGEVISVSFFYKKLNYPMEIYKQGDNRIYELRNNKSADNRGMEAEVRKSLAFTKVPVLKNITLYGNFTWLDAKVVPMSVNYNLLDPANPLKIQPIETTGPEEKRPQTGASNYIVNAGVYYDARPISLSLSYNYVSNRMFRPALYYRESLFERPLEGLDAQLAIKLLKQKMQLRVNASNLLNSRSLVYRNFYVDPAISAGTKAPSTKQLLYQKGDLIDYEASPGRTFSTTISYNF